MFVGPTIYNPVLVKFVHVTPLHLGVPLMGRQQIEAPWTFHMAFAYGCNVRRTKKTKTMAAEHS